MDVLASNFRMEGRYELEQWRNDSLINKIKGHNGITLEGKTDLLFIYFNVQTLPTAWYIGLLETGYTPADATDDLTVIAAAEFTDYSGANRLAWGADSPPDTENDGNVDYVFVENTTTYVEFTIAGLTAETNVYGMFLCTDAQVKAATAGELWCTAPFSGGELAVNNADILKVKYKVRVAY